MWADLLSGRHFRGTIANRKRSGELYWSEQTITPLTDDGGRITHFVSVQRDVTALREKRQQDLQLSFARELQQRFYRVTAEIPGFDISANAYPADDTGGDYFDVILRHDGTAFLVVADVSGHGFGSALLMAETRAYLRSFASSQSSPGGLLTRVNEALAVDLDGIRYVTLTAVHIDPATRSLTYASAGHVPGFLLDRSRNTRHVLESLDPPLGLFPNLELSSSPPLQYREGDTLVLLTDGVSEAANADDVEYGAERALEFVRSHPECSAEHLVERMYDDIRAFTGDYPQQDDITSLICRVTA
jgi:sigma-B regulation protein RsbU (phosphoserine phosphatase)